MKYCIFSKIVMNLSPEEIVEKLQEFGYDGVEWRIHDEGHFTLQEVQEKAEYIRKTAESHKIETVSLIGYLLVQDIKRIEKLFGAAEKIGCSQVRLWPPPYDGKTEYCQLYNQGLTAMDKVNKLAQKHNIRVIFETHPGTIMSSSSLAYRWVSKFSPEQIGVIFDPGNMISEGMENWKLGLEVLGDYLAYVHCKNTAWFFKEEGQKRRWYWEWVGLDEGMVNWKEVINFLKQKGYDGYLSNEDFREISVSQKLKENLDYLKKIVEKTSI